MDNLSPCSSLTLEWSLFDVERSDNYGCQRHIDYACMIEKIGYVLSCKRSLEQVTMQLTVVCIYQDRTCFCYLGCTMGEVNVKFRLEKNVSQSDSMSVKDG